MLFIDLEEIELDDIPINKQHKHKTNTSILSSAVLEVEEEGENGSVLKNSTEIDFKDKKKKSKKEEKVNNNTIR